MENSGGSIRIFATESNFVCSLFALSLCSLFVSRLCSQVKWTGLSYSQCTWETKEDVDDELKIAQYRRFNLRPTRQEQAPEYTQAEFDARRDRWYPESPTYKTANKLRDYQIEGLNFLIKAWYDDRNTILADEMVSCATHDGGNN